MQRNFYYSKSDDAKEFIEKLNTSLEPIVKEFVEKGYTPEQIMHGVNQWCFDRELNFYLNFGGAR